MDDLRIELDEGVNIDTLTGETTQRSVLILSGMRSIYISVNTLVKIADFLKEKGIRVVSDD